MSRGTRSRGRRPGFLRVVGWVLLLLGALSLVTWRQTRGLRLEAGLRDLESRRAMAEAERVELVRRIEQLRSRARVVRVARDRLGLHLPTDREIVFLSVPQDSATLGTGAKP